MASRNNRSNKRKRKDRARRINNTLAARPTSQHDTTSEPQSERILIHNPSPDHKPSPPKYPVTIQNQLFTFAKLIGATVLAILTYAITFLSPLPKLRIQPKDLTSSRFPFIWEVDVDNVGGLFGIGNCSGMVTLHNCILTSGGKLTDVSSIPRGWELFNIQESDSITLPLSNGFQFRPDEVVNADVHFTFIFSWLSGLIPGESEQCFRLVTFEDGTARWSKAACPAGNASQPKRLELLRSMIKKLQGP